MHLIERKHAEEAIKAGQERGRDVVRRSPIAMLVTHGLEHRVSLANDRFTALFGYTIEDVPDAAHLWPLAYPDEWYREGVKREWQGRIEKALRNHTEIEPMEAVVRCKDGTSRFVEFHFSPLGDSDLISFVDLTERKRGESALRESEQRFRLVANSAPVMIWMAGLDKLCDYFNDTWLAFTGRPLEAELGNGWAEGVHAEDVDQCVDTYVKCFDRRESFQMEYRLRRHDGEYRWIFDSGVPRFNADGSFAGYIGSCIDITSRRLAEEALSSVSRRLIEAHEEERTWIARELHDDINQRVALLAVNLEQLRRDFPASNVDGRQRFEEICLHISHLGSDIQALSHRLHSSKLEYLGLTAAATSFCKEFSDRQGVNIDFRSEGIPHELPPEISLCLFRVLQESIQNATKYSGARRFQVVMIANFNEIEMTVSDPGIGFDLAEAMRGSGMGLTSMKERLKLVDGELSIQSQLHHGTTIRANVPFSPAKEFAHAAAGGQSSK